MTRLVCILGWSVCWLWLGVTGCAEVDPRVEPGSDGSQETMPAALRAAWIRRVQNDAGAEYAIARTHARKLEARHPRQNLRTQFTSQSVELTDRDGGAPFRMTLSRVNGRDPGHSAISNEGNRVTMSRPGIDEWYVHGPMGLEQGFTIPRPVATDDAAEDNLRLSLAIEGNYSPSKRGDVIVWSNSERTLETRELFAFDADGKQLSASMRASRTELTIEVHTAGASYPIEIDPLWVEQQKLVASTGTSTGWFGHSVSISGNTAVIGMPRDGSNGLDSGSAHVFIWSGTQWDNQQKLLPSDGAQGDEFGISVSVSGDTAVVGSLQDDDNGAGSGSAYVFVRSGSVWTEQQKLTASDGAAGDQFGCATSISGNTVVIGSQQDADNGTGSGSAYVFVRSGVVWSEEQKLLASNGAADDQFGSAVGISDDTVLVGASGDDDNGTDSGSAYVFDRSGSVWTEEQQLLAADAALGDGFGFSVFVEKDSAIIGAPLDDDNGAESGSAYVFVRSGVVWTEQQKLRGSGGAADDRFGHSVGLSGDSAVVGAARDDEGAPETGSTYVFVRSGVTWSEQQKLLASGISGQGFGTSASIWGDHIISGAPLSYIPGIAYSYERSGGVWTAEQKMAPAVAGPSDQELGYSVSISGDTAVVGGYRYDSWGVPDEGAVYVFVRSGTLWTEQQELRASDREASDQFGTSVSIDGDTIIVGTPYDDDRGLSAGAAYVFVRSGTVWTEQQKLLASDGAASDRFGHTVSISGDTAVVGAVWDDDAGSYSGSAYVFARIGVTWTEEQKLVAPDGAADDYFGIAAAVFGDAAAIGSFRDDDLGVDSGSVYVFTRSGTVWSVEQKLVALDGAADDVFGYAVSLSGDTLAVAAPTDDSNLTDAGSVYVFTRSAGVWTEQQELFPSDAVPSHQFGTAVSLDLDTMLVGASFDAENGFNAGAAYVFARSGSVWNEVGKVLAPDAAERDELGWSVGLSGETALIGAPGVDDRGPEAGAAYAFILMLENGDPCSTNGQCLSDLCDPFDLVCACVDAADCLINEVCDISEDPNVCEPANGCGNGVVEAAEACDDGGTIPGDGCSATCFVDNLPIGSDCTNGGNAACASGVCDASETPDSCEATNSCGNGAVEAGEACDDGNGTSGDGCSATCFVDSLPIGSDCSANGAAACASGVCDTTETPDRCEAANSCGNGLVEAGEVCDDGNGTSGDGCSATCFTDDLPIGGDCSANGAAACASGVCDTTETPDRCEAANSCGNGLVEAGETCDDGNSTSGDGCSAACFVDNLPNGVDCSVDGAAACASGVCDTTETPDRCEAANSCGNGLVEAGEACDDGNGTSGDGCSATCFVDSLPIGSDCTIGGSAACASGVCDTSETPDRCEVAGDCGNGSVEAGEACDDGNGTSGDGCSATCFVDNLPNGVDCSVNGAAACASGICDTTETPDRCEAANSCGNGVVEAGEACDDGNGTSGDGCSATCFVDGLPTGSDCTNGGNAACASGVCDTTATPDTCEMAGSCGNGVVEAGEACDDGNGTSGDGCSATCFADDLPIGGDCSANGAAACASGVCDTTETPDRCEAANSCGNGLVEAGETCDDGNGTSGDGCSATCFVDNLPNGVDCSVDGAAACASGVCDTTETPDRCEAADSCGNGVLEVGEVCDDGNAASGDGCSATCSVDDLPIGADCTSGGDAACASGVCDATETPDTCEAADNCGNGVVEAGEACDDGNGTDGDGCSATCSVDSLPIGSDCTSGGDAACASGICDTTETPDRCEAADSCGNGVLEVGEACDDGNGTSGDGCSAVCFVDGLPNGADCSVNGAAACASDVCDTTETPATCEPANRCGNGVIEAGEACDDGNGASSDGCSAACFVDSLPVGSNCTNGGNAACAVGVCDTTETPATCEPANLCGNGVLEGGELCDDGNGTSGDGCSATCFVDNLPNGVDCSVNGAAACASDVCDMTETPATCEAANVCGNGVVESGEACDDGGTVPGDGCSATCFVEQQTDGSDCTVGGNAACASGLCDTTETPNTCEAANRCGNTVVEGSEVCDDGNTTSGDGCDAECLLELGAGPCTDGAQCASGVCNTLAAAPMCAVPIGCGNGVVDFGEACDDGNQIGGDGCAESCNLENSWRGGGGGCAASAPSDSRGQGWLLGLLIVGLVHWRRHRPMSRL